MSPKDSYAIFHPILQATLQEFNIFMKTHRPRSMPDLPRVTETDSHLIPLTQSLTFSGSLLCIAHSGSKHCSLVPLSPSHVWLFTTTMDCSMPGFPVPHHLPEFVQVHVHCIGDATQPSYPLSPSSSCLLFLSGAKAFYFLLSTAPIFKLELNDKSLIYLQITSYKVSKN